MSRSDNSRARLLMYLLGELSAHERGVMEQRLLADQEFSDEMQEAEYDLIEDYRQGRLAPEQRQRAKKALGRSLLTKQIPTGKSQAVFQPKTAHKGWGMRLSLAGAIVLVLFAGWFAVRHFAGNTQPSQSRAKASVNPPATTARIQDSGEKADLPPPVMKRAAKRETEVLLLASGISRGAEGAMLELQPATKDVLVQWVIPENINGDDFELVVRGNGETLAAVPQLGPLQRVDGTRIVEFHLRAAVLQAESPSGFLLLIRRMGLHGAVVREIPLKVIRTAQ